MYSRYSKITTSSAARLAIAAAAKAGDMAVDLETTALSPAEGRVRTINISSSDPKGRAVIDCDQIMDGFSHIAPYLFGHPVFVFYASFERLWFDAAGVDLIHQDVGHMRRAVIGGGHLSLKSQAKMDLDVVLEKEQQLSDWNAPELSKDQWDYAFLDAEVTRRLGVMWRLKMTADQRAGFAMFNDMVPAVMEMESQGMYLDTERHRVLVASWEKDRDKVKRKLVKAIGSDVANIRSDAQLSDYFSRLLPDKVLAAWPKTEKTGQLSMKADVLRPIAAQYQDNPLGDFLFDLIDFKHVDKYLSSFGESLITSAKLSADGRIRARYNIGAARTGRFSSSGPNLQQIPRGDYVRESFAIPRAGRCLVSLDYSGIELRCLAMLSGDERMLEDTIHGDLHLEVAQDMAGRKIDKETKSGKELRRGAKAVSFHIIYGGGAPGLAANTRQSIAVAGTMIDTWKARYPKAFEMRFQWQREAQRTGFLTAVDGGTIYVKKTASLPRCANYPVQRAALAVMAKAIKRHKISLDALRASRRYRTVQFLATIHDALIDEATKSTARRVLAVMKDDMVNGYLDIFPGADTSNLVEGGTGPNWGTLA